MDANFLNGLRKDLSKFLGTPYDDLLKHAKFEETKTIKFLKPDKYYKDLILVSYDQSILDEFDVEIEFCETKYQHDIWEFFRVHTSSVRTNRVRGRTIRMLVKHIQSGKYIGILALCSDVYALQNRDRYLELTKEAKTKEKKLNYIMNIACCVGLQPIAYNFNIGKLLVNLCYSDVVLNHFKQKYGHDIACITTFSINGKSIQYDRLPQFLKYIGKTKGYGFSNIPDKLYKKCCKFLDMMCDSRMSASHNKMLKINKVINYLDLDINMNEQVHNRTRGIYIGFTCPEGRDFMAGKCQSFIPTVRTTAELVECWKHRWARMRFEHLLQTNRLRHNIELINAYKIYNIQKTKRYNEHKIEELGAEEFKKIKREKMQEYRKKGVQLTNMDDFEKFVKSVKKLCLKEINTNWLAGFIDGDGSIYVRSMTMVTLDIPQCDPTPLIMIQQKYGGSISYRQQKNKETSRPIFILTFNGNQCRTIMNDIKDYVIIEKRNVEACLRLFEAMDKEQQRSPFIDIINATAKRSHIDDHSRISYPYIAGFFDAEGEIAIRMRVSKNNVPEYSFKITQKQDTSLLKSISKFIGYGTVDKIRLAFYSKDYIVSIVQKVLPFSIVKKNQLLAVYESINCVMEPQKAIDIVDKEKHKIIELSNELRKFINADGKTKVKKQNVLPDTDEKHIAKAERNKEKSDAMKGENNPNFGKVRKETHSMGIMVGATKAKHSKRKLTDDQILEIRERHKNGQKITAMATEYGVSHQYISDVTRGRVLTLAELDDENLIRQRAEENKAQKKRLEESKVLNLTQKELCVKNGAKSRRKVPIELIVQIMKYKYENQNTKDANDVFKMFKDQNSSLSLAMVKNYVKGKIMIFQEEFPVDGITFQEFDLIHASLKSST